METQKDKIDEFIQKTLNMKKQDRMDLSSDEDLSIAIMNLVSMEEHFFFTGAKTGDDTYFDLLNQVRSMRKDLLKRIIKDYEGEVWCISKHLLAASMRLMEYGTKLQSMGNKEDAKAMFQKAYDLYSLFWGLNLNLISVKDVKKIDDEAINKHDDKAGKAFISEKAPLSGLGHKKEESHSGFFGKLGDVVRKAIDCCIE
jgi:hypothetical protein